MSKAQTTRLGRLCDSSAARLVLVYVARSDGISAAAKLFRTGKKTVRKWTRRYDKFGAAGLLDLHRAPYKQAQRIPTDVEQQVLKLRREHPTLGARRLIREFRLPLSHGTVDRILKANNLLQTRRTRYSREEEAKTASLFDGSAVAMIPVDAEGDALSSPFEIQNLAAALKRLFLANGWHEGEQLDARVRNCALGIHFSMLIEPFKTPPSAREEFKVTPPAANPAAQPGFSSDDWQKLVATVTAFQQEESKQTPLENRPHWNGPDDPKFKAFVEKERKRLAYHSELAKLFGVTRACEEISDGHLSVILADMVASMSKGRESVFDAVMRDVVADVFVANDLLPGPHYWRVVGFWSNLLVAGLFDEFWRRTDQNEVKQGREVIELIVEEDRRFQILKGLGKKVAALPSYTGEFPPYDTLGDAESEACIEIWKRVARFMSTDPPAANPEFLKATITGEFNKILLHVRDNVWYQRECEREEGKRTESSDDRPIGSQYDARSAPKTHDQEAIEFSKGRQRQLEEKIVVEQLLSKGIINDREKKVIEFVKLGKLTQAEAAKELRVSQPTVNRCLKSGLEKLCNELVRNKTATNSLDKPPNN